MTQAEALEAIKSSGLQEGDSVEWNMRSGGIDCGVVSAVTESRVYVKNQRRRTKGRGAGELYDCEFWWDACELGELRKVVP